MQVTSMLLCVGVGVLYSSLLCVLLHVLGWFSPTQQNIQEQDMQQNTQQGRRQCINSNTQAHRRDLHIYILTAEDSSFLIKKILTPDDGHIGQNM
jgi:hypothetical protein